jgi:IclR family transcriptional regulator, KDG regulon repressor
MSTYVNAKSAVRVLDILEFVAAGPSGLSRAEIAETLGIPKSSASILLRTLVDRQYLRQDPATKRLKLGVRTFETGQSFLRQVSIRDAARPALDALVREFGRTCHLATLDGRDVVYLDKVDPPQAAVQLVTFIGSRLAAVHTAVGRAQLAHLSDEDLELRFDAASDVDALRAIRASRGDIRRRGWASEHGETTPGICCVAATIMSHSGAPIAAIGITYLDAASADFEEAAGTRLRDAAHDVSLLQGYRPPAPTGIRPSAGPSTERRIA